MPVYQRRTRVAAPLDEVWAFHADVSGLEALTPDWMGLEILAVRGPDGTADPDELVVGTEIDMAMRPFGAGPKQRWTSRIVGRGRTDRTAWFRDEMVGGPFRRWVHTHRFAAEGDETMLEDRVEYALPGGPFAALATPASTLGFEAMFRGRHRTTKALLEE